MTTTRKLIGKIIKHHREQSDMTQQQLGDKIGKDRQNVWKIENGVAPPITFTNVSFNLYYDSLP